MVDEQGKDENDSEEGIVTNKTLEEQKPIEAYHFTRFMTKLIQM